MLMTVTEAAFCCAVGGPEMASLLTVDVMNLLVRALTYPMTLYKSLFAPLLRHTLGRASVRTYVEVLLGRDISMGTAFTQCGLPADEWHSEIHCAQEGGHMPVAAHQKVTSRGRDSAARCVVGQAGALLHKLAPLRLWQASHMTICISRLSCFLLCCTLSCLKETAVLLALGNQPCVALSLLCCHAALVVAGKCAAAPTFLGGVGNAAAHRAF